MDPFEKGYSIGAAVAANAAAQEIESLKKRVAILELKDMPLHPLHTRKWLMAMLEQGEDVMLIRSRRTGKSTVQALTYIAKAISNPGKHIEVSDHFGTPEATRHLMMVTRNMVHALGLQHIHFDIVSRSIIFENRNRGNEQWT